MCNEVCIDGTVFYVFMEVSYSSCGASLYKLQSILVMITEVIFVPKKDIYNYNFLKYSVKGF